MNAVRWNRVALVLGLVLFAVGGPWLVHEVRSLPPNTLAGRAGQRVVTLEIAGMTCDACAASVHGRLAQVPGVSTCDVRYHERRAYVVCGRGVADTTLTSAVHRAGPGFLAAVANR